ncbi:MAG TPA: alpha-amylase family glycosyl hydrolase, partial [Verrucomicrobiae bacterium]|nr:alpha-amylase family glycosyl hydrolase [Verrucomicrobiae bacterium]
MNPSVENSLARWAIVLAVLCPAGMTSWANAAEAPPALFAGLEPIAPDPVQSLPATEGWQRDAVVYHVWLAAFRDSDGNGIGDLRGVIQSLDTLRDLRVNTLWLSPFFENASSLRNLHGYDVTDHHRVDPRFGTNADA